jgi:hypothetical protein
MSKDAASDVMAQLRQQKKELAKAASVPAPGAEDVYSKLVINVQKRRRIWLTFPLLFLAMLWLIQRDLLTETHWFAVAIPVMAVGSVALLIPPSEDWRYRPWQSRARRVEQHILR